MSCPDCGCQDISYFDYELTCQRCGLVVGGSYIDDSLKGQPYNYGDQVAPLEQDTFPKEIDAIISTVANILTRYIHDDFPKSTHEQIRKFYTESVKTRPVKGRNKTLRVLGIIARVQRSLTLPKIVLIIQSDMKELNLTDKELLEESNIIWQLFSKSEPTLVQFRETEQENIQKYLIKLSIPQEQKRDIVRVYDKLKKRLPTKLLIRKDIFDWTLILMSSRFLNLNFCFKEFEKKCEISYTTLLKTEKLLKSHLVASNS